jgi:hypothetical protein
MQTFFFTVTNAFEIGFGRMVDQNYPRDLVV